MVHETQHYYIMVVDQKYTNMFTKYQTVYAVVNKETGVEEHYTPSLPEAIHHAEASTLVLKQKSWTWMHDKGTMECTH